MDLDTIATLIFAGIMALDSYMVLRYSISFGRLAGIFVGMKFIKTGEGMTRLRTFGIQKISKPAQILRWFLLYKFDIFGRLKGKLHSFQFSCN